MNYPDYLAYYKATASLGSSASIHSCLQGTASVHSMMHTEFDGYAIPPQQQQKLYFSKVEMEELNGGLEDHAVTRTMRDLFSPCRVSMVRPRSLVIKKTVSGKHPLDHVISLETIIQPEDLGNSYEPWLVISTIGGKVMKVSPSIVETNWLSGKNAYKVSQYFDLKLIKVMSCVQFYCNVKKCRFENCTFKEGDLLSIFVNNSKCKSVPDIPMISVVPWFDQTYVPMSRGQRLQVITDFNKYSTESSFNSICYNNEIFIKNDHSKYLCDNLLKSEFFTYFSETYDDKQADVITVQSKSMPSNKREIIIPAYHDKDSNYPIVVEPDECVLFLCVQNIDGFVYRSYNRTVPTFDKDCKLQIEERTYTQQYLEVTIKVDPKDSYYIIEGSDTEEGIVCAIRPY